MTVNSLFTTTGLLAEIERVQQLIVDLQAELDTIATDDTNFSVTDEKVGQAHIKTAGSGSSQSSAIQQQLLDLFEYLKWLCKRHLQVTKKSVSTLTTTTNRISTTGAKFEI